MLIEILYVAGCPNHEPAVNRLKDTLRAESVAANIREIEITNESLAESFHFPGSPTIRINGIDVEAGNSSVGVSCRLYSNGTGVPSAETLKRAIASAKGSAES